MLTIRTHAPATNPWLVARVYWSKTSFRPMLSVRLFGGDGITQIARGALQGARSDWAELLFARRGSTEIHAFESVLSRLWSHRFNLSSIEFGAQEVGFQLDRLGDDHAESPVAVFAAADFPLSTERWAWYLHGALSASEGLRRPFEVVPANVGRRPSVPMREHFALPIRITCARPLAEQLLEATWFLRDDAVREHGMRLEAAQDALPRPDDADIVVADGSAAAPGAAALWLGDTRSPARLRVLANAPREPMVQPRFARGSACLTLPILAGPPTLVLNDMLKELTHDRPLHYVVSHLRRRHFHVPPGRLEPFASLESWQRGPRLYADPASDRWFRLSSALQEVTAVASRSYTMALGGAVAPFVQRLADHAGAEMAGRLEQHLGEVVRASEALRSGLESGMRFDRESSGLKPMSDILAGSASLQASYPAFVGALQEMLADVRFADALQRTQERRVDASVEILRSGEFPYPVGQEQGIPAGSPVRLTVHIGQRAEQSLVVGEPPALDPLLPELPEDQVHELEIVLFPKDFSLADPSGVVRKVSLARFGGTVPVSWELVAPSAQVAGEEQGRSRLSDGDTAELRFSVYYRNQLLQSFRLQSTVKVSEWSYVQGRTAIQCDFSQTRRFGNLDDLGDRVLSMSLNDNSGGKHMLGLKGSGLAPSSVEWDGTFLARHVGVLRDVLFNALAPGKQNAFSFDDQTFKVISSAPNAFDDSVRQMAKAGANLLNQLLNMNGGAIVPLLRQVRQTAGRVVQVALHQATYTLPWGLIYDYKWPTEKAGVPLSVCRGVDMNGKPCNCTPDEGTGICLRGFWGFRHVIEQLVGTQAPLDDVPGKIAGSPTAPTMGFIRTIDDDWVGTLSSEFKKAPYAPSVVEYPVPKRFLELLRKKDERPALVLYVGHQAMSESPNAPEPYLLAEDDTPLLQLSDFTEEWMSNEGWSTPRSLVMMMGCGTGTSRVDTGISLSGALLNLGAVGVLGTECTVYTDIVSRMARDLSQELLQGENMGEAMQHCVWRLAQEGCPMGLVFTYLGPAEAGLPK